ncbi:MAG: hypothetical protein ACJ72U_12810 [Nitrososphaeraceae archaeon]
MSYPQDVIPQKPTRKQVKPLKELESGIEYIVEENRKLGVDDETIDIVINGWMNEELEILRNYLKEYASQRLLKKKEKSEPLNLE